MANVIRTMKDVDGNTVFPRTYAQAVTIGDGSVNLEGALSNRPEKPSLLPAKTTLADTDLVTIEGTGGVVNKMTVGKLKELLGIDSGGIVASGGPLESRWVKFADGTMIQTGFVTSYSLTWSAFGGMFRSDSIAFPYSEPFRDGTVPSVSVSPSSPLNFGILVQGYAVANTQWGIRALSPQNPTGDVGALRFVAIGRWK